MSVVDLHPEDLIDKLAAGTLTATERVRLNAHFQQCSVCRFEIGLRNEVAQELPTIEQRPQLSFPSPLQRGTALPRLVASLRPHARRRWPLGLLAAALVLCAGGAAAAVLSGAVQPHWLRRWVPEPKAVTGAHAHKSSKGAARVPRLALEAEPRSDSAPAHDVELGSAAASASTRESLLKPAAANRTAPLASTTGHAATPTTLIPTPAEAAASSRVESAARPDPAATLFAEANRARRDGNAERALSLYRALQNRYPNSAEGALSRALVAQLLLDRGSPGAALAGFDRYLATGAPGLSAEALVGRARALEQLDRPTQAAAAWREVQNRFPGSIHARLAATRLSALGTR